VTKLDYKMQKKTNAKARINKQSEVSVFYMINNRCFNNVRQRTFATMTPKLLVYYTSPKIWPSANCPSANDKLKLWGPINAATPFWKVLFGLKKTPK